jgi:protein phosphatase PTC7
MLSIRYATISPLKHSSFADLPFSLHRLLFVHSRCYSSSTGPSFSYRISAAYSAKKEPLDLIRNSQLHNPAVVSTALISSGLAAAERKLLRPKSGQDAFFLSNINASKVVAFGVIDGVGGWEESGIDPSNFSHTLGEYLTKFAIEHSESAPIRPRDLLNLAYEAVQADQNVFAGGSTACIATASPAGTIEVAKYVSNAFHWIPLVYIDN